MIYDQIKSGNFDFDHGKSGKNQGISFHFQNGKHERVIYSAYKYSNNQTNIIFYVFA